ncbi:single-stranded DNA-binding protein [Occultella glacieicola]|uniref:Single-stranded DNA-binding protein n=1 Tax=Occultella glacieicola TaxID=2518684 RepID=A0ABY2E880_9MICO|nr:single-stranded DNA-binding protein [Occultella glacieicola]TDE97331.1 single-stranded DNA-binding protein [Occultella glacieicola]
MPKDVEVTIQGHVGQTPTLYLNDGRPPFVNVGVATTPRFFDRKTQEWRDGATQWYSVKANGDLATNISESVHKGDAVLVQGRLSFHEYTTKDGGTAWEPVIRPTAFALELSRVVASVRKVRRDGSVGEVTVDVSGMDEVSEEEAPPDPQDDGLEEADAGDDTSEFEDGRSLVEKVGAPF